MSSEINNDAYACKRCEGENISLPDILKIFNEIPVKFYVQEVRDTDGLIFINHEISFVFPFFISLI